MGSITGKGEGITGDEEQMRFERQCTRFIADGKLCRLTGYSCNVQREIGEPGAIASVRESVCYWFTRDPIEGKRELQEMKGK